MKRLFILILSFALAACGGWAEHAGDHHEDHAGHDGHEAGVVRMSEESQKLIGLKVEEIRRQPLLKHIEVVGEVAQESENVSHIQSPVPGRITRMDAELGQVVEKRDPLFALETSAGEISTVRSPGHGIVLSIYSQVNETVDNLTTVLSVADPDVLKAGFNVYEKDIAGIKTGQRVRVQSVAYPDEIFEGEIVFISPRVDEKSRTIKIRVNIRNEEHLLKYGMFVTGKIQVPLEEDALVIPEKAVQDLKGRSVVFVPAHEAGEFEIREVTTGRKSGGQIEIASGLREGERVVSEGGFYLKSELLKGELGDGHAH